MGEMARKPITKEDLEYENPMTPAEIGELTSKRPIRHIVMESEDEMLSFHYPERTAIYFIKVKDKDYVVDTSGYDYARYVGVVEKIPEPKVKVEYSTVKDGIETKRGAYMTNESIKMWNDKGYTVGKTITEGNKTQVITYSPLTKQEHNEAIMKQQRALYSRRSTSKRSTRRTRKSSRLGEVY
jgi:hypothetical protein